MSVPWIVAGAVLTAAVVVLSAALVAVMARLAQLETTVARMRSQITLLRSDLRQASAGPPPPPEPAPAAAVLVMLEPARTADVSLADEIRRVGGLSLDVPTTVFVPDDGSGSALADGLALEVASFYRDAPLSVGFPSVVVLDDAGGVLATGSPSSVSELEVLVTRRGRVHAH